MALVGLDRIRASRLLPVVVLPDAECAVPLGEALIAAGLPVIEITCRTSAAVSAIGKLRASCPDLLVGAGTVLTVEQASEVTAAGAQFLVSPCFDEGVLQAAEAMSVPMLPGVLTPTEVGLARARGLGIVKIFPAGAVGGAAYIHSLAGVYPGLQFVPTGGVGPANLKEFLALESVAACGGSWLAPIGLLRERRFEEYRARAAAAVATVAQTNVAAP